MREDAPIPSKSPFRHPVTTAVLEYFVHPGGEAEFEKPWVHDGMVHCSNRWLAIRFFNLPTEGLEENPAAMARLAKVPWDSVSKLPKENIRWRRFDDCAGSLWRYGPRPLWERTVKQFHPRIMPLVRVGIATVSALPFIQLIARLPRAEVWTDGGPESPLFFRFNGGDGVMAPIPDYVEGRIAPAFNILQPPIDPHTGWPAFKEPNMPVPALVAKMKHEKPAGQWQDWSGWPPRDDSDMPEPEFSE